MGFNVKLGPSPKLHFLSGRVMTDRDGTGWDGWDGTGWVVTNWNVTGWDGRDGSGWVRTGPENKKNCSTTVVIFKYTQTINNQCVNDI